MNYDKIVLLGSIGTICVILAIVLGLLTNFRDTLIAFIIIVVMLAAFYLIFIVWTKIADCFGDKN